MAQELVTVYRSAEESAAEDAAKVHEVLTQGGYAAVLLDDKQPEVPEGVWEVRVPAEQEEAALALLARAEESQPAPDASHDLDFETVFEGVGTTAELEAMSVKAVLDAAGVPSEIIGTAQLPTLPFVVKVPRAEVEAARAALEEARQAGAAGAEAGAEAAREEETGAQ